MSVHGFYTPGNQRRRASVLKLSARGAALAAVVALTAGLLAGLPDAVLAPAAAVAGAVTTASAPAVSVAVAPDPVTVGADDLDAAAFLARRRVAPVFPAASLATVAVPVSGSPSVKAVGQPVAVGAPDAALVAQLGVDPILRADAAAPPADPVARATGVVTDAASVPVPAGTGVDAAGGDGAPPGLGVVPPAGSKVPAAPSAVSVEVLGQPQSSPLGVSGFAFVVRRSDRIGSSGPVALTIDVSGFADSFGADYLGRLRVVRFPECALDPAGIAPQSPCGLTSVVPSVVDRAGKKITLVIPAAADPSVAATPLEPTTPVAVSATDPVAAGDAATTTAAAAVVGAGSTTIDAASGVFALTTGVASSGNGAGGTFAATSLSTTGTWSTGGGSGSATYDYPLALPPATGGATPKLALQYSSGSVDGMTLAANTQASWAGLGWDLSPGFVERKYNSCEADGHPGYADLCWRDWNATLSLGGTSYQLIPKTGSANHLDWYVRDNPGYLVRHTTSSLADGSSPNGSTTKEWWLVRTPDGTKYYFGRGYGSFETEKTNSTFSVPVFADDAGEPGYVAGAWTAGQVDLEPWRWNLDRIEDQNGNVTRYYYTKEQNRYGKLGNASWPIVYTRGGVLEHVEYGSKVGAETSFGQRVVLATAFRCTTLLATCAAPSPTAVADPDFPDTPTDLMCLSTTNCAQDTPSFFTARRLAKVTTAALFGATWNTVDTVDLTHTWVSPTGSIPQLWLDKIQRTAYLNGVTKAPPAVTFDGVAKPNRADAGGSVSNALYYRLSSVYDESGAQVSFTYDQPDPCVNKSGPWNTNTQDCYPVWWVPQGQTGGWAVFNKYVLAQSLVHDRIAGSPDITTSYTYAGGGAWHHNDEPNIPGSSRTWDQWRGYSVVKAITGSGADRSATKTHYYRGMDGDNGTSVTVTDFDGATTTVDADILAGRVREVQRLDSADAELSATVTGYTAYLQQSATADWPEAAMVRPTTVTSRDTVYGTTTKRKRLVTTDYDATYGVPLTVTDSGNLANTTDATCVSTDYTPNTSEWIIDKVYSRKSYDGICSITNGVLIGKVNTYYDGSGIVTDAPTAGNPTRVVTYSGSGAGEWTEAQMAYGAYGRLVLSNQKLGAGAASGPTVPTANDGWKTTKIDYNPATGPGSPTRIDTTNDKGQTSSVALDGLRGVTLWERKATAAGQAVDLYKTSYTYDPLGRVTTVTLPGTTLLNGSTPPSYRFSYTDWSTTPTPAKVVTETLVGPTSSATGDYLTSADYYDGLGRVREHQVASPNTGRIVTATRYTDMGAIAAVTAGINASGSVGSGLMNPAGSANRSETRYEYDELGRTTSTGLYSLGIKKFATTASHYGDRTISYAPQTPTANYGAVTTISDVFGNPTTLREALPSGDHEVSYGYDPAHRLRTVTTQASSTAPAKTLTTDYDWMGRVITTTDVDAGITKNAYDDGGRKYSTTTKDGATVVRQVTTAFDGLDRPVSATSNVSGAGSSAVTWTYDLTFPGSLDETTSTAYLVPTTATPSSTNPSVASSYVSAAPATTTYRTQYGSFDSQQRPHATTYVLPENEGALGRTYVFGADWDLGGRPVSVTSPAVGPLPAETITYAYGTGGYPRSVTGTYTATPSGGSATGYSTAYVSNLAYSDTGQLLTGSLGQLQGNTNLSAAVNLNYTYEPDTLRLSTAKVGIAGAATLIADQTATYDSSGLPTVIKDVVAGGVGQVECYRYDSQQRLTAYLTQAITASPCASLADTDVKTANVLQASGPDGYAALYTLDDLGQLTKLVERRPTTSAGSTTSMVTSTITRDPIRVHAIKDVARVDNIANAALPAQAFLYDGTGRQTKRTLPAGSRTVGDISNGVTTDIGYDGNGRMVSMTDTASSGTAARRSGFVYDASGALIARHDDDAGDDLAATGTRPAGQRTVWLGTGGSAGIGAIGMAGTGGLQIQISRKPGASATTAGTASAADPAQQLVTVTRSIMAPVLANGGLAQVASHTASAMLSTVTTGGVLTQAPAPLPGRVWFTVGDAHASLGGAGSPSITIAGNGASSDPASAHSQSVTVAGAGVAAWNGASTPPAVAPAVGIRRTTPYGGDRTAPATAAPAAGGIGATGAATSKNSMAGSMGGNGFLNAIEDTLGSEDGPALPGAPTITGSGYPTTGLILLGARGYDPALGEFTAPDPVSNAMNPSDAGSYTYANHRLGIATDPTGAVLAHNESGGSPSGDDHDPPGPSSGDGTTPDPVKDQEESRVPWSTDGENPFAGMEPAAPTGAGCGWVALPWSSGACVGEKVSTTWGPIKELWDQNTPSFLRGIRLGTAAAGVTNTVWGYIRMNAGLVLFSVGTAEDATGFLAWIGVPTQTIGASQMAFGGLKALKGVRELTSFAAQPRNTDPDSGGLGTEMQVFAYDVTPVIPMVARTGDWLDQLGSSW
jgi:hypothetical protein